MTARRMKHAANSQKRLARASCVQTIKTMDRIEADLASLSAMGVTLSNSSIEIDC